MVTSKGVRGLLQCLPVGSHPLLIVRWCHTRLTDPGRNFELSEKVLEQRHKVFAESCNREKKENKRFSGYDQGPNGGSDQQCPYLI